MAKKKMNKDGIVYSTDPGFNFSTDNDAGINFVPAEEQKIRLQLDKKQRAGKTVTLITGFENTAGEIEKTGKELRRFCGTGGSSKDGEVIIQGDFRQKALQWLLKNGYKKARVI